MRSPERPRWRPRVDDPDLRLLLGALAFFLVAIGVLVAAFVIGLFH